jgi:hypothetical protein
MDEWFPPDAEEDANYRQQESGLGPTLGYDVLIPIMVMFSLFMPFLFLGQLMLMRTCPFTIQIPFYCFAAHYSSPFP